MERYKQFDRLVVDDFETDVWEHPLHNHNHYELIFIVSGSGIHHLNKRLLPYESGFLYLLGPEDEHEFMIEERTRFIYFKFTKLYPDTYAADNPSLWNKDMDIILNMPEAKKGNVLKHDADKQLVAGLFDIIVNEYKRNELLSRKIIFQLFKALVLIVKRNKECCGVKTARDHASEVTEDLLEYIELHIYDPKMLTKKQIGSHFHYSPNYIGTFFKERVGTSLRTYVQQYRYKLLEQRLKHSNMGTKQLALEFGFTDESHLHKFVKSQAGVNLNELRSSIPHEAKL